MSDQKDLLDPGVTGSQGVNYGNQRPVPNAGGILALGIISIATCWLHGVPGLVCGLIGISMHKKAKATYTSNPDVYQASYNTAKAGYICAIIGTCLSGVWFLIAILAILGAITGSTYSRF